MTPETEMSQVVYEQEVFQLIWYNYYNVEQEFKYVTID